MIVEIYTIYDKKSLTYEPPRYLINEATAKRLFTLIVSSEQHKYRSFATDYEIYFLGKFDDEKGLLLSNKQPEFKWNATELLRSLDVEGQNMLFQENKIKNKKRGNKNAE